MPTTFGVHRNVETPLTIGMEALMGAPLRVKPTEPWTPAGATVATSVTGTPCVMVEGAVSEIVLPLGVTMIVSCGDTDVVALLSPL